MKKIKDAIVLFVITIIAGLMLGGVNELTKDTIAKQEEEETKRLKALVRASSAGSEKVSRTPASANRREKLNLA